MDGELLKIGIGGVVPVTWEAEKADGDPGTLAGYASVWNVVDGQDDVVVRGAFRKTLSEWRSSKRVIPLVLDHQHRSEGVIGSLSQATEDTFGLKFTARFSGTGRAQDARAKAREGHLAGLSIFGPIFKKSFELRDGREIRILQELGLMEVSLTPFPANDRALVSAAKAAAALALPEDWVEDMRAALSIRLPHARKVAIDHLVQVRYGLDPAEGDAGDGGEGSDDPPQPDGDAAKYALELIGASGPDGSSPGGEPSDSLADLLAPLEAAKTYADLDQLLAEIGPDRKE